MTISIYMDEIMKPKNEQTHSQIRVSNSTKAQIEDYHNHERKTNDAVLVWLIESRKAYDKLLDELIEGAGLK